MDIICTAGTPATLAAKQATTRIPIVFGAAAFPDRTDLVASYARPSGNLTGVAFIDPEYGDPRERNGDLAKQFEPLGLTIPQAVLMRADEVIQ